MYGSEESRALALRTLNGTGKLKTSHQGRLLPFYEQGLTNDGGRERDTLFVAGDVRAQVITFNEFLPVSLGPDESCSGNVLTGCYLDFLTGDVA